MTRNNNSPKKSDTVTNKYCILIPARNESQVIEQLLISIEKQTKKNKFQRCLYNCRIKRRSYSRNSQKT